MDLLRQDEGQEAAECKDKAGRSFSETTEQGFWRRAKPTTRGEEVLDGTLEVLHKKTEEMVRTSLPSRSGEVQAVSGLLAGPDQGK